MSFFDEALKAVLPSADAAGPTASAIGSLILGQLLNGHTAQASPQTGAEAAPASHGALVDGLGGLVSKLDQAGLGDIARSWIGTGANKPVDASALGAALGNDVVAAIAAKTGLSADMLQSQLAKYLPSIVDHLTPGGHLPGATPGARSV